MQRVRATGSAAPDRYSGHRRPLLGSHERTLRRLVETKPDITLAAMQAALHERAGLGTDPSTIHHALRRIGLRHKSISNPRPSSGPSPLELYDELPFVLIGNSGQRDPEVTPRWCTDTPGGSRRSGSAT